MTGSATIGGFCCLALTALLGKQEVAAPESTAYNESLDSYFSVQQMSVMPACIVSPQNAQDVSAAIGFLSKTQHDGGKCSFAVRSGGHTSWAGASNIAGGVVLDLRALDTIQLSEDKSIVSVGAGASWDLVYGALEPLGLSVNGGRASGVGVGGLTLGGGISYFSPRYGWTCDTVSNFQAVLADGSIVEANDAENPDLFKALKGGNNNFGIVTRVDLSTFEQGLIWTGSVINNVSYVDDIIAQFVEINSPTAYDEHASFITTFGYSQAQGLTAISNQLEYTIPTESPPPYQGIFEIPSLRTTSQLMNITSLAVATEALQPEGARSFSLVSTLVSEAAVIKAAYEEWNASVPAIANVANIVLGLVLEPLPPIFYGRHAKTNSLGLETRDESLVITLVSVTWSNAEDDALVMQTATSLNNAINKVAQRLGGSDPYIYLNYAGQDQDPIGSYGSKSVSQLLKVRKKVDPEGVFTYQVPGGYKIPSN